MTRAWTGLLVLAGLLMVGASEASAQDLPREVEDLAEELRRLDLDVQLVPPGDPPVEADLRSVENANEAMAVIAGLCDIVVGVGGELAEIWLQGSGGWYLRLASAAGCALCALIG